MWRDVRGERPKTLVEPGERPKTIPYLNSGGTSDGTTHGEAGVEVELLLLYWEGWSGGGGWSETELLRDAPWRPVPGASERRRGDEENPPTPFGTCHGGTNKVAAFVD